MNVGCIFCNFNKVFIYIFFFFFNDTATTEIYTLSLHDALPIWMITLARDAEVRAFEQGIRPATQANAPTLLVIGIDRKSTRLNSSHIPLSRMPSSA